jgi:hypothetical protein
MRPSAGCRCREGMDWHGSRTGATQLDRVERIEFRVEDLLSWMRFEQHALEFTINVRNEGRGKFKPMRFSSRYLSLCIVSSPGLKQFSDAEP